MGVSAVDRETAWLSSHGDGLPALLVADGGRWDMIAAYEPRTPPARQKTIFVTRRALTWIRFGGERQMATHDLRLALNWPVSNNTGDAQQEQRDFDTAVDDLVARILGSFGDKTHGGRFLSVAEKAPYTRTDFMPAAQTMPSGAYLSGEITYSADDPEIIG